MRAKAHESRFILTITWPLFRPARNHRWLKSCSAATITTSFSKVFSYSIFPSKRTRVIFIFRCTDPSFALIRNRINRKIWSPSINKEAFRIRIFFIRLIFIYSSMNNDKTRFKDSIYSSTNYKACVSGSWLIYRCFYYCSFLHGPLDQFIG